MLIELFIAARLNSAANSLKNSEPSSYTEEKTIEMIDGWWWKMVAYTENYHRLKKERLALKDGLDKE
jgi:hypothetical protein